MNATRVSICAGRRPGRKLSTLALLVPMLCSSCGAAGPSRIYILSGVHGCKVTTYTMDGKPTEPTIQIGGFGCTGIAVDAAGRILVAVRGPRGGVVSITPDGKATPFISSDGASGLALDSGGNIHLLVAKDINTWIVRTFMPDGRAFEGLINIKLNNVSGIAVDHSGKTFVVSQGNQVVQGFGADGRLSGPAIRTGNTPRAIAVRPDGGIYVANFLSVTASFPDGRQARAPLSHRNPETLGLDSPMALAVDEKGTLYVGYDTGYVGIIDGKSPRPAFMAREDIRGIAVHWALGWYLCGAPAGMSATIFPPPFPFIPFLSFLHQPLRVESFRYKRRCDGGNTNPPPALVGILYQLTDDEWRQYAGHPNPVSGGTGTYGATRMVKRPSLLFGRGPILSVWLCCTLVHSRTG
jgi:hypothetical protein